MAFSRTRSRKGGGKTPRGIRLAASAASYLVSGAAASLKVTRMLAASAGSYAISGVNALLTLSSDIILSAGVGSYGISGTAATLTLETASDFPDATTTGVQDGISLSARGDWDINSPGVYEDKDVTGYVYINANDVTLRNCRVTAVTGQVGGVVIVAPGKTGVIIEYCDIDGDQVQGLKGVWVDGANGTIVRFCDISFCEDGIYFFGNDIEIRDNYVHDLVSIGVDPHHDSLQFSGTGIVIDHNTLIGDADANACLQFGTATGPIEVTINNNLMRPGPVMLCLINIDDDEPLEQCDVVVTNNHMEEGDLGGGNGFVTWDTDPPDTWTGNVDADTLEPIPPPT